VPKPPLIPGHPASLGEVSGALNRAGLRALRALTRSSANVVCKQKVTGSIQVGPMGIRVCWRGAFVDGTGALEGKLLAWRAPCVHRCPNAICDQTHGDIPTSQSDAWTLRQVARIISGRASAQRSDQARLSDRIRCCNVAHKPLGQHP